MTFFAFRSSWRLGQIGKGSSTLRQGDKGADAQGVRRGRLTYLKQFRNQLNDTLLEWIGKLADGLDINQFNKCIDPG
jgi:hypothetical protein